MTSEVTPRPDVFIEVHSAEIGPSSWRGDGDFIGGIRFPDQTDAESSLHRVRFGSLSRQRFHDPPPEGLARPAADGARWDRKST